MLYSFFLTGPIAVEIPSSLMTTALSLYYIYFLHNQKQTKVQFTNMSIKSIH